MRLITENIGTTMSMINQNSYTPIDSHILIVDDEESMRKVLQQAITRAGYKCSISGDGEDALEFLDKNSVDIVVTDISMPGISGIELLQLVKEKYNSDVIVMTGFAGDYTYEEMVNSGASDFVQKPLSTRELIVRLERVLRERTLCAEQSKTHLELKSAHTDLKAAYLDTINRLVLAAEYKDEDTADHIVRMSRYSALLAEKSGLAIDQVQNILYAAPMHDIGKIGIPDNILMKPGKLTNKEFELMKTHTNIGANILANSKAEILQLAEKISISHHEKWNGTGYPLGLSGSEIPIEGRIVGITDVFDALTTKRPYKRPYSVEVASDIIKKERNQHFDPDLVDIFLENLDEIQRIRLEVGSTNDVSLSDFVWSERDLN